MYAQRQVSSVEPPWGDAYVSCPCGGAGASSGVFGWVAAHPWLSLVAAIAAVLAFSNGGKR